MSKHSEFDKVAAAKKMYARPRKSTEIQQEYANVASSLGDKYFSLELNRAEVQKFTLRLSELKDEHEAAVTYEREQQEKSAAVNEILVPAADAANADEILAHTAAEVVSETTTPVEAQP